jgi:hypothetical protein
MIASCDRALAVASPTTFSLLRHGLPCQVVATLTPLPPPVPRTHGLDAWPLWLLVGGLLFAPLTAALVDAASSGGMPTSVHDVYQLVVRRRHHGFRSGYHTPLFTPYFTLLCTPYFTPSSTPCCTGAPPPWLPHARRHGRRRAARGIRLHPFTPSPSALHPHPDLHPPLYPHPRTL